MHNNYNSLGDFICAQEVASGRMAPPQPPTVLGVDLVATIEMVTESKKVARLKAVDNATAKVNELREKHENAKTKLEKYTVEKDLKTATTELAELNKKE